MPIGAIRLMAAASLSAAAMSAPAAGAQPAPASVTLSPATAQGIARPDVEVGPFGFRNGTTQAFDLRLTPVLLGQARDGGLFVRLDRASRERARALMTTTRVRAGFAPGAQVAAAARVHGLRAGDGLYGGVLFEATPRREAGPASQIRNVLRVNARVLLDPPPHLRRIDFAPGSLRAEQAGRRHVALRVPVTNHGNAFTRIAGRAVVRDALGSEVARVSLPGVRVLPGATVELAGRLGPSLAAGDYAVEADLRAGSRRIAGRGEMHLVGPGTVPTRRAALVAFSPGPTFRGERAELRATYRNTGNVAFAPEAELVVRHAAGPRAGRVVARVPAVAERTAPGRTGAVRAAFDVPPAAGPLELAVRIGDRGRALDGRHASVTPVDRPPLLQRLGDALTRHAPLVLLLGVTPLLVALALGARHVRRLQARLRAAERDAR
jgi:hypothetical protein